MKTIARIILAMIAVGTMSTLLLPATSAGAHAGAQAYMYLDVSADDLGGRVELPFLDVETVFGLDLSGTDEEILAELEENLELLQAYVLDHMSLGSGGEEWVVTFDGVELLLTEAKVNINYAVFNFTVAVAGNDVPRQIDVSFDPFFDEIDGRDALLLIANDWEAGVFDNEAEALVAFDANTRQRSIDLGDTSQWTNFTASIELGVDHIRSGPDHIFFVLVLLLPSVLVFKAGWEPAASAKDALWRVLKVATMFTVAHSITFTLAGLDLLPLPPSRVVESIIALSIAVAALHNLRPIVANREWAIAFAFGLFHGMGFAGLVSGLDVSRSTQLVSLLGRNVGIEIGQAIVILLMFGGLFILRRTQFYRPFFVTSSLALAALAAAWTLERVLDKDFGFNQYVESIIEWPRVVLPIAVFTALCAGAYIRERNADRLIGADETDTPEPDREMVGAS
ncbi:MAG: HupE/UreJ family protein [Actinobacteria bacterium]|nr:HupE/UreJ family protein [Actinomycetota bacterium]